MLVDSIVIPNVHGQVIEAISASSNIESAEALGIMETFSLSVGGDLRGRSGEGGGRAADRSPARARASGGKSFVVLTGEVRGGEGRDGGGERRSRKHREWSRGRS